MTTISNLTPLSKSALSLQNDIMVVVDSSDLSMSPSGTTKKISPGDFAESIGIVNVKNYGAVGDGVTDDTAAIQAAIDSLTSGGLVYLLRGTYLISTRLDVDDDSNIHLCGDGYGSVIQKGFNGDMISLGLKGEMSRLRLNGAGASFTGRGVIITTGSGGDGWQNIHDCTILDTASYCIEYTASGAGWMSRIVNNRLGVYNRTTFAVKYPTSDSNGPRLLANNSTLSPLADLGGSAGVNIIGNLGGEDVAQTIPSIQMNDDLVHAVVMGNAFECVTSITIKGDDGVWVGNVMRGGYTVAAGAGFNRISGNGGAAVTAFDTDNSGATSNEIDGYQHTYTPTWTGSGSNPAIGDGTITASYQRHGRTVALQINVTMGSTTTFGTGTWAFSLPTGVPAPGAGNGHGVCRMFDSGTVIRTGVAIIDGTSITAEADSGTGSIGTTVPFTWASGDKLSISITYTI